MKWPKKIVIIRHGESEHNYALDVLQGDLSEEALEKLSQLRDADISLTNKGIEQAKKTGRHLKNKGIKFDICFISPYKRTVQTAENILLGLESGIKVFQDIRLREKEFGRLHGVPKNKIKDKFPEEHRARKMEGKFYYRLLGGENYPDVAMRVHSFLDKLVRDYSGKNILIITHQVPYKLFRFWFEHLSEEEVLSLEDAPNCAIQIFECDVSSKEEGRMKLVSYNEIGY